MGEREGKPDGLIDVEGTFVGDRLGAAEGRLVGAIDMVGLLLG